MFVAPFLRSLYTVCVLRSDSKVLKVAENRETFDTIQPLYQPEARARWSRALCSPSYNALQNCAPTNTPQPPSQSVRTLQ